MQREVTHRSQDKQPVWSGDRVRGTRSFGMAVLDLQRTATRCNRFRITAIVL
jgi:hypothetical protein